MKSNHLKLAKVVLTGLLATTWMTQAAEEQTSTSRTFVAEAGQAGQVEQISAESARTMIANLTIGLSVQQAAEEVRKTHPQTKAGSGLSILQVAPNSDASNAGLANGDILLTWNGEPLADVVQLNNLSKQAKWDQPVNVSYLRGGVEMKAKLTVSGQRAQFPNQGVVQSQTKVTDPDALDKAAQGKPLSGSVEIGGGKITTVDPDGKVTEKQLEGPVICPDQP